KDSDTCWLNWQSDVKKPRCPCGGTGRRTRFKIALRKEWVFESLHGHQFIYPGLVAGSDTTTPLDRPSPAVRPTRSMLRTTEAKWAAIIHRPRKGIVDFERVSCGAHQGRGKSKV